MPALQIDQVLREEASAIHGPTSLPAATEIYDGLLDLKSAALCLSGGGIRSASFALGVIQALAKHPCSAPGQSSAPQRSLLARFNYLSTVSGGGYIGSWLSVWISRKGWAEVRKALLYQRSHGEAEPTQLAWLRSYSNYLTPTVGVTSPDAWAGVALYLRNLILNWFVIVPPFLGLLVVLKLIALAVIWFALYPPNSCQSPDWGNSLSMALAACAAISVIVDLAFNTRNRPTRGDSTATQRTFLLWGLLPALAAGSFFALALVMPCSYKFLFDMLTCAADGLFRQVYRRFRSRGGDYLWRRVVRRQAAMSRRFRFLLRFGCLDFWGWDFRQCAGHWTLSLHSSWIGCGAIFPIPRNARFSVWYAVGAARSTVRRFDICRIEQL